MTDAAGHPVVGAEIALGGNAQAVRFTNFTGGYDFNVSRGSYSLSASGACSVAPASVALNNVAATVTQNFVATTSGCVTTSVSNVVSSGQVMTLNQNGAVLGQTFVTLENWVTSAAALARLPAIGLDAPTVPLRSLTIAGLPAINARRPCTTRRQRWSRGSLVEAKDHRRVP